MDSAAQKIYGCDVKETAIDLAVLVSNWHILVSQAKRSNTQSFPGRRCFGILMVRMIGKPRLTVAQYLRTGFLLIQNMSFRLPNLC